MLIRPPVNALSLPESFVQAADKRTCVSDTHTPQFFSQASLTRLARLVRLSKRNKKSGRGNKSPRYVYTRLSLVNIAGLYV